MLRQIPKHMNTFHRWFCKSSGWKRRLEQEIIPWALRGVDLGPDLLEVGSGPGLTTDILRTKVSKMTAVEIDPRLAESLQRRLKGTNVRVVHEDATDLPLDEGTFSAAVSFTMLHHVPSAALQDKLLSEVYRVLKPGGVFAGTDSRWSRKFQVIHLWDTMVLVDPDTFESRLQAIGFTDVSIKLADRAFRFQARRPNP
jgi:SAM-dependent methyltransferase